MTVLLSLCLPMQEFIKFSEFFSVILVFLTFVFVVIYFTNSFEFCQNILVVFVFCNISWFCTMFDAVLIKFALLITTYN